MSSGKCLVPSWAESWTYIKTVLDVLHEPILILDKDLRVTAANKPFYTAFQVEPADTENKVVYELGNGQWDIPDLRSLLEDILPKHTYFKGFEVSHRFPLIGQKIMILNARQIYIHGKNGDKKMPAIIMLAIEDVTEMMDIARRFADRTNQFESKLTERTNKLEINIEELEKEVILLKSNSEAK